MLWRHAVDQEAGTVSHYNHIYYSPGIISDTHYQVTFSQLSVDGDEGYPGDVLYNVTYSLCSQGGLGIK